MAQILLNDGTTHKKAMHRLSLKIFYCTALGYTPFSSIVPEDGETPGDTLVRAINDGKKIFIDKDIVLSCSTNDEGVIENKIHNRINRNVYIAADPNDHYKITIKHPYDASDKEDDDSKEATVNPRVGLYLDADDYININLENVTTEQNT